LSRNKEAKDDLEQAYNIAKDDPEIVYWHSVELAQENLDEAIDHLKEIINSSERCDVEFLLAQMLKQRNSGTDFNDAVEILENKIKDLAKMPYDFRVDYLSLYFQIRSESESFDQIKQDFDSIRSNIIDETSRTILCAEVLLFCKEIPSSIKQAKPALLAITWTPGLKTIIQLSGLAVSGYELSTHKPSQYDILSCCNQQTSVCPQLICPKGHSLY